VRLGFAYVRGLGPSARAACDDAVRAGANTDVAAFWRHTLLPRAPIENLVRVGAFDAVAHGRSRRQLLWELKAIEESLPKRTRAGKAGADPAVAQPAGPPRGSGAIAGNRLGDAPHQPRDPSQDPPPPLVSVPAGTPELPVMDERTRVTTEYSLTGVSTGPHLVTFIRAQLERMGCSALEDAKRMQDGSRVRVAGLVITRQAPVSASGFRFFTLADEGGHIDLVLRPDVAARTRDAARHPLLMVDGTLQVENGRINVVVRTLTALDGEGRPLADVSSRSSAPGAPPAHDFR
jgi:DNA polymerase III alpha subunit